MILRTLLEDPEQYMILRSLLEGPDTMEAPGHMSPGHMSTRTSVSPGHMSTRTHVYPDKNARTPVARTHIPRTTGAASKISPIITLLLTRMYAGAKQLRVMRVQ